MHARQARDGWLEALMAARTVDSEVEEEAAAHGDSEASGEREALELNRRDGVEAADGRAEGEEPEN